MEHDNFKGMSIHDSDKLETLEKLFNENRAEVLASLPWLVSELIEAIGFKDAMAFINTNGGSKIYIRERNDLTRKFGFPASEQLYNRIICFSDSSGYLEVPSPWGGFRTHSKSTGHFRL